MNNQGYRALAPSAVRKRQALARPRGLLLI